MARPKSLATMSLDALLKLRDDVADTLSGQVEAIQEQLARFTGSDYSGTKVGNGRTKSPKAKVSKLKGRKAAVKYRDKEGNKWSGRGAEPRWMTAAIKGGAKRDDFLVGKAKKAAKPAKKLKSTKPAKSAKRKLIKRKVPKPRVVRRKPKAGAAPTPAQSSEA
jgi:DNA-binding protein H-NS